MIFAGYALSRFSSYRGVKAVSVTILLSQMVPGVLLLIPLYLLMMNIIFRIILPVSIPSLIATALFAFVNAWNEFLFGFVFINDEAHRTLTPGITLFKGLYTTDWGSIMAASVLSVIPIVILFIFMQRFLIDGMTAGAVKG